MNVIEKFNLQDAFFLAGKSVFLSGLDRECVEIEQYFKEAEKRYVMWFYPGKKAMGPPGYCHGGFIAAILDESMGTCCWLNGLLVMTAKMELRCKTKLPINNEYIATAYIKSMKGRRVTAAAEISDNSDKVYAAAEGTFLSIPVEKLAGSPGYEEQMKKTARFFELRRQGVSLENIFKELGQPGD